MCGSLTPEHLGHGLTGHYLLSAGPGNGKSIKVRHKLLQLPTCTETGSSAAVGLEVLVGLESFSQHHTLCFSTVPSCVFLSHACFSLTFSSSLPVLSHSLLLFLSLWADRPSALILLCTVLLQMRQARRLSNPCIQRYTSRIGECSSTYVSSSKSPL